MHKILFVDDDPMILKGLSRALDEYMDYWEIDFATSGKEALNKLPNTHYDAIITDMQMPVMDGFALLENVSQNYPEILRFILSGNTSDIQAINAANFVHQMFSKPSEMKIIFTTVEQACRLKDSLSAPSLIRLITSIKSLPSTPLLYNQLITELKSNEPNLHTIGEIVSKDTAMTAKILQLVNSAFFGLSDKISNPQRAVTIIGINTTKALVLSAQVFSEHENKKNIPKSIKNLWNHSMTVSNVSRKIAADLGLSNIEQENAQVSGILHDIGKLLQMKLPNFSKVLYFYQTRFPIEIEYEHLGTSHAEMGAYLLGIWGLPLPIVEAVMYHHTPSKHLNSKTNALTAVHIANGLLNMCNSENQENYNEYLDMPYLENLIEIKNLDIWQKEILVTLQNPNELR